MKREGPRTHGLLRFVTDWDRLRLRLERALGEGGVLADPELTASYARDESEAQPVVPPLVLLPRQAGQVAEALRLCAEASVPVTARGGGTGRAGGAVPTPGGVVLSLERMDRIVGIEPADRIAVVQPGLVLQRLHEAVEAEGLFYPPDPNSLAGCTLGGNVATNAGGPRALKYGSTRDWVLGLQVALADGSLLRVGRRTKKGVTGYDLTALLVGSEGTLALSTEITVRLVGRPQAVGTLLAFLGDVGETARLLSALDRAGLAPRVAELLGPLALRLVQRPAGLQVPEGAAALLLVELDGGAEQVEREVERAGTALLEAGAVEVLVASVGSQRERLWAARRELSRTLRARRRHKLSEDVVVPPSRLGELLRFTAALGERLGIEVPSYGHAGDGNLHVNFLWDDPAQSEAVHRGIAELFEQVVRLGGTLTGEHGLGLLKAPYLPLEQAEPLVALQERIAELFDPRRILNPDKLFPGAVARFHGAC